METKICTKCKEEKSLDDFYGSAARGKQYYCKLCSKHARNREKDLIKNRRNYLKIQADPILRKKKNDQLKGFRINNRIHCLLRAAKSRAKKANLEFNIKVEDIILPEYCPVLKVKLTSGEAFSGDPYAPSLDRIDNSKGYIEGNVEVISLRANRMKNCASFEELKNFCEYYSK